MLTVLQREGAKFTEAPGKDWSLCMLLTCNEAQQPGEALALLRLAAHTWVFCRVTGPGASDAGVISERVTALRQKRKHHQQVWKSYRGHMSLQDSEEPSSAVTLLSGAVKGHQWNHKRNCTAGLHTDWYVFWDRLSERPEILARDFFCHWCKYSHLPLWILFFFHFWKVPVQNYGHKLSPMSYFLHKWYLQPKFGVSCLPIHGYCELNMADF